MSEDEETRIIHIGDHSVVIAYDPNAGIWYVQSSSVPGLSAEAPTEQELIDELPLLVRHLSLP
jgi:hypothetical protein